MAINLFDQAKAKAPKATKPGKPEEVHYNTPGLELYAQLDKLEKHIKSLKNSVKPDVTNQMLERFINKKNKDSYKAEDGSAKATLYFAKKASNVGLKPEQKAILDQFNIPTAHIAGDFTLNVEDVSAKKLQEVSDAISKVKGLPKDFVSYSTKKERDVVTEASIEAVFKLNDADTIKQILGILGSTGVKPQTTTKLKEILAVVAELADDSSVSEDDDSED